MGAAVSKRYQSLTLKKKLEILDQVRLKEKSKKQIAEDYGLPFSTLSTLIKFKEKISLAKEAGFALKRKKVRQGKFPKLEEALIAWIKKMRSKNISVDCSLLKKKAEEYALKMKLLDDQTQFTFSDGWVQNFKRRHDLTFRKVCGEGAAADTAAAAAWKETTLKRLLEEYRPENIFNADETGLFFKLLPNRTLAVKGEKCTGGILSKERITVMLASNMTGTEKLKLFVIGKSKNPRCFKGLKSLPVKYAANKKAWMTQVLYEEWLRELDRKLDHQNRKIVLIVDNCTAHPVIKGLKAITVEFLPPNVTSILQPMDQGVIQSFKLNYRNSLLQRIILNIENDQEYQIDLLRAIYLAAAAWDSVTEKTLANCFAHAGFLPQSDSAENPILDAGDVESGRDLLNILSDKAPEHREVSYDAYFNADNDLECHAEGDIDESILANIEDKYDDVSSNEDEALPDKDLGLTRPPVTTKQATEALDVLKTFFTTKENSESSLELIVKLEKSVFVQSVSVLKQKKITGFFK